MSAYTSRQVKSLPAAFGQFSPIPSIQRLSASSPKPTSTVPSVSFVPGAMRTQSRKRVGSVPVMQRIEQHGEGRCVLASAGIVQIVAGKGLAPLLENADERPGADQRRDIPLRQVGQPDALQGAQANQADVADDQLSLDAHVDGAARFLEIPNGDSASHRVP